MWDRSQISRRDPSFDHRLFSSVLSSRGVTKRQNGRRSTRSTRGGTRGKRKDSLRQDFAGRSSRVSRILPRGKIDGDPDPALSRCRLVIEHGQQRAGAPITRRYFYRPPRGLRTIINIAVRLNNKSPPHEIAAGSRGTHRGRGVGGAKSLFFSLSLSPALLPRPPSHVGPCAIWELPARAQACHLRASIF